MSATFRIEVPAVGATVVHLASKQAGKDCAGGKNSSEHDYRQERIGEAFHLRMNCGSPAVCNRVEIAATFFE
jgi:hypothetical protein